MTDGAAHPVKRSGTKSFGLPYEPGMSILDALMWIRRHGDSTLAFRYSCINANVCKECTALVDGKRRTFARSASNPVASPSNPFPSGGGFAIWSPTSCRPRSG